MSTHGAGLRKQVRRLGTKCYVCLKIEKNQAILCRTKNVDIETIRAIRNFFAKGNQVKRQLETENFQRFAQLFVRQMKARVLWYKLSSLVDGEMSKDFLVYTYQ